MSPSWRRNRFNLSIVRLLNLGRGAQVESAVEPFIVPPPHGFEIDEFALFDRLPAILLPDQHGLLERIDCPGHRVVVAIPARSGRGDRAINSRDGPIEAYGVFI